MTMRRLVCGGLILGLMLGAGCGDDDDEDDDDDRDHHVDAGAGVCDLSACPTPDGGIACCTPIGTCGADPTGLGLSCYSNRPTGVCDLSDCPTPLVGVPCCTPNAMCGSDPFATGAFCFPNAAPVNFDAAVPPPPPPVTYECDLEDCPTPATGVACCAGNNVCGSDPWGIGLCFANLPEVDAAIPTLPPLEPYPTEPPDDPSVTGECPSFLGLFGPVWGCCSQLHVCGVFQSGECLVPIGSPLPVDDEDAGIATCTPPVVD